MFNEETFLVSWFKMSFDFKNNLSVDSAFGPSADVDTFRVL